MGSSKLIIMVLALAVAPNVNTLASGSFVDTRERAFSFAADLGLDPLELEDSSCTYVCETNFDNVKDKFDDFAT